jgi:predicted CXXCH cytochrome family protein
MSVWRVTEVRRRRSGRIRRRSRRVERASLRIGREPGLEVHTPDLRMRLRHGELVVRQHQLVLEVQGRVRALPVQSALRVGPYELRHVPPESEDELHIEVELVQPLGDDLEELVQRSAMTLRGRLRRRWVGIPVTAGVLLLGALVPLGSWVAADPGGAGWAFVGMWNSGRISSGHQHFSEDCATCHTDAFVAVADRACVECHDAAPHTDEAHPDLDRSCADCHEEHAGERMNTADASALCIDCHEDEGPLNSDLAAVPSLAEHPPFAAPAELAMEFSHALHGAPIRSPEGEQTLECTDCHTPDGADILPLSFDQHCADCHVLGLESWAPGRTLPHGDEEQVKAMLADFYAANLAAAPNAVTRRLPGQDRPISPSEDPEDWLDSTSGEALGLGFGRAACGRCHLVEQGDEGWTVVPPGLPERWQRAAEFDHRAHGVVECTSCHDAADSQSSTDSLLPPVERCIACHADENATGSVPTACVDCHGFHP